MFGKYNSVRTYVFCAKSNEVNMFTRKYIRTNANYLEFLRTLHSVHILQSSVAFEQETPQNSCCSVELSGPEIYRLIHFGSPIILHHNNTCHDKEK